MNDEKIDFRSAYDVTTAPDKPVPVLSLVLPTTGNGKAVKRCLGNVIRQASETLLRRTELIIYLNRLDELKPDIDEIRAYCIELENVFGIASFLMSPEFHGTAEESALAGARHATGNYLWICGDQRVFLPEGIAKLEQFVLANVGDCAYFNSKWADREGKSFGQYSTFFGAPEVEIPYSMFVQHNGVNFIATGFGAWVVRREILHFDVWQEIIARGGAHFSHVFFYLDQIGNRIVKCFSVFLFILEAKSYHYGDVSEWDRYAMTHSSYRYFPWTLGLVRKYRVLFERGTFTPQDVRRSMCCERTILIRQIDEILRNLVNQLSWAISFKEERLSSAEFDEILSFCKEATPENLIVCDFLARLFEQIQSPTSSLREKRATLKILVAAVNQDLGRVPLVTSIIGQVGDYYVRLHPKGYLYSSIDDTQRFLWAYRLLDGPVSCSDWAIVAGPGDMPDLPLQGQTLTFHLPLESTQLKTARHYNWRSAFFKVIVILHNSVLGHVLLSKLPRPWLHEMRKTVRRLRGWSATV